MPLGLLALLGCPTEPVLADRSSEDPAPASDTAVVETFAQPTSGDTGTQPDYSDLCATLPSGNVPFSAHPYYTGADFDFDAQGRIVSSDGGSLLAWDGDQGGAEVLAWNVGPDPRGIQVDHVGALLVSSYARGTVERYNPLTGASATLLGGLVGPTGLEVGEPDVVYVAESASGRVIEFDGPRMAATPIASLPYPTHLALAPSGDVLYVSDLVAEAIWAIDRVDGTWGEPRVVVQVPEPVSAMEVDSCGNLYGVTYGSGRVFRFDPQTGDHVRLATLPGPAGGYGAFVSARWGSDRGPWRRDVLYVSDYFQLWAVEVGVPGPAQPVDAL